ncbi:MAG: NAD+ synthase [bacterium]
MQDLEASGFAHDELAIDPEMVAAMCRSFISAHVASTGAERVILGLSGGIDSALVAYLVAGAIGADRLIGVLLPTAASSPSSQADAEAIVSALGCQSELISIEAPLTALIASLPAGDAVSPLRRGNIAARLRMTTLYDRSALHRGVVVGTGNKSEILIGYSTIYGDAASAFNPIGDLYKTQVRALSRYLGVPAQIIAKAPSADLWPGQTDEGEGGFDYSTLDHLLYRIVDRRLPIEDVIAEGFDREFVLRVNEMIRRSEFKRQMPPIAKVGGRSSGSDYLYPRRRPKLD